jgi:hypothetical protein
VVTFAPYPGPADSDTLRPGVTLCRFRLLESVALLACLARPGERDVREYAATRVASPETITAPNEAEVEGEALSSRDDSYSALASLMNHGDCHISSNQSENRTSFCRWSARRARGAPIGSGEDGHGLGEAADRGSEGAPPRHREAGAPCAPASDQSKRLPVRELRSGHDADGPPGESALRKSRRYGIPLFRRVEPPARGCLGRRRGSALSSRECAYSRDRDHAESEDHPSAQGRRLRPTDRPRDTPSGGLEHLRWTDTGKAPVLSEA